jgi:hypothetical protein
LLFVLVICVFMLNLVQLTVVTMLITYCKAIILHPVQIKKKSLNRPGISSGNTHKVSDSTSSHFIYCINHW